MYLLYHDVASNRGMTTDCSRSPGVRLAMHAAHRLIQEDGKLALIAACAAGGQVRTGGGPGGQPQWGSIIEGDMI